MTENSNLSKRKSALSPAQRALFEKRLKESAYMQTRVNEEIIQPFYFGAPEKPLFGCYHAPNPDHPRECGIVFCHSMGEEYIRFHRTARQLAFRLSNIGFPVLRFDYYGCGDSGGDHQQWRIDQWLADTTRAVDEMKQRTHAVKVCLIGLRLGGSLSLMSAGQRNVIDGIVLWDAVVNGRDYVAEMIDSHENMLRVAHVIPRPLESDEKQTEILGFPLSNALLSDLESVDLMTVLKKPANNILIIESNEKAGQRGLLGHLRSLNVSVEYLHRPHPRLWVWKEDFGQALAPQQILRSVVSWISEVYS
jgi:pimeloyl-ACP methyl ester carboxylesterase